MKWSYGEPKPGDMIRVAVGTIYHFGIYVSDDEVIQFGLPPSRRENLHDSEVEVMSSDIDGFLAGGFLEVCEFDKKERKKNRKPRAVIEYARSRIGMRGYNILYNNCEHFANECVTGVHVCRQAEDVRAMFRNMPIVDVYIAAIPEGEPVNAALIGCKQRRSEIEKVSNERVKREKYFVWRLLEYALERSFGKRRNNLEFKKEQFGGWSAGDIFFSLSHSEGALAVAVSRARVGVDIELVGEKKDSRIAERIFTEGEMAEYNSLPEEDRAEYLIKAWTMKEAIFKSEGKDAFIPIEYDTLKGGTAANVEMIGGKMYSWSVATDTPEKIRVFRGINLSEIK